MDDPQRINLFFDYIRQNRFREVRPLIESYLKTHPNSWQAYYQLGYVYFRRPEAGRSIRALAKSLELNPLNADAHKILGLNHVMLGSLDDAEKHLQEAARLKPDSAEIRYLLGRVYYTRDSYPLARQEFEEAVRLDPTYVKAYDNLGLAWEALGNNAVAVENYHKAIELSRQQGLRYEWPYINLSTHYNRQNQPDQAVQFAEKAIEINPRAAHAHFEKGRALRTREEWEPAARALGRAIELDPRKAQYYYVLSYVYKRLGKEKASSEAMSMFRKLEQAPRAGSPEIATP